ncbi:MAG: hybrid sensor histidine kinase/response regulator [Desulfobacteraceae bacterium]|jgi:signal transduction histidine kinase
MNRESKIKSQEIETILLVDDEQDIRDVLQLALVDAGHQVVIAENGEEALARYTETQPPIVITDIKMPVMDGIELLKNIKQLNSETEVIMITGHGDMDLAIRSLKYKATDFITKPINVDALEIALRRAREKILMRKKLQAYTTHLEALVREKTELQDHLSSLGLMIGSISHGIKGLLTGLDGGMYLLETGLSHKNQGRIDEGWETVKMMVERVRKMVMDILFHAKKRDLQWENVDVKKYTDDIARMMTAKLNERPIEFETIIAGSVGKCQIDPGYINAALMNIFENAIDACQRDTRKDFHHIVFEVREDKGRVVFSVADDGIGMDAETQAKLFTEFFSTKGRKGTGLGLYIANKIIEQHGGTIEVSSAVGRGSKFRLAVPKQKAEQNKD